MVRRFIEGIFTGMVVWLIPKGLDKFGGIEIMKSIIQTLVAELWPIWFILGVAVIYWFVRFLLDIYKTYRKYNKVQKLISDDLDSLEEKIGVLVGRTDRLKDIGSSLESRIAKLESHDPENIERLKNLLFPKK